jgi:uncharacterized membrane protein (Fun14 family)
MLGDDVKDKAEAAIVGRASLLTSRTFWLAIGLFGLSVYVTFLTTPDRGSWLATFAPFAPTLMPLSGSYAGAYAAGWAARKAVSLAAMIVALTAGLVVLLTKFGIDASMLNDLAREGAAWVGAEAQQAQSYLSSFLPSAGAAAAGGVMGFRKK